jgi:hypothetical protein
VRNPPGGQALFREIVAGERDKSRLLRRDPQLIAAVFGVAANI